MRFRSIAVVILSIVALMFCVLVYRNWPGARTVKDAPAPVKESPLVYRVAVARCSYRAERGLGQRYLGGGVFRGISPHGNPNGGQVVFSAPAGDSAELILYDSQHGEMQRLTETPYWELDPIFSHSGSYIVFYSDEHSDEGEIYSMRLDRREVKRMAPGLTRRRDDLPWIAVGNIEVAPLDDK